MESEYKHNITFIKTQNNNMVQVKIALKRALLDYEEKRRSYDPAFDIYNYLQNELSEGFAEPTVRKYLNTSNSTMFEPEKLLTLCDLINDYRPIDMLQNYLAFRKEIKGAQNGN